MATTEQRLAEYEKLYKKAQGYDPNAFQNDFQKSYGEATNYNSDLINQQASSLGELQAVAPTLREQYSNSLITDPTKQMALIAQARQAPITNWGNAAGLLEARGNKYSDILGKALGGYQTSASQANTAAENAWRLYQDAVQQSQFNRSQGGGGGFDLRDFIDSDGDGIPDYKDKTPNGNKKGVKEEFGIPDGPTRKPTATNILQDSLAKGILDYQNAPNVFQKYLQLQKGTGLSSLAGPYGLASYIGAVAPSVWSDIKGLFNRGK